VGICSVSLNEPTRHRRVVLQFAQRCQTPIVLQFGSREVARQPPFHRLGLPDSHRFTVWVPADQVARQPPFHRLGASGPRHPPPSRRADGRPNGPRPHPALRPRHPPSWFHYAATGWRGQAGEGMHSRGLIWTPTQPLLATGSARYASRVRTFRKPVSSITRVQALPGDPNHVALNGIGTCT
jgi:hypothetical protein